VLPAAGARLADRRRRQSTRAVRTVVLVTLAAVLALAAPKPSTPAPTGTVFGVNDDNLRLNWNPARTSALPASNQIGVWIDLSAPDRGVWDIPADRNVLAQVLGRASEWAGDPGKYAGAVRELVLAHPNIREVQVWNEPDLCVFPCAQRRDRAHPSSIPFRGPTAMRYLDLYWNIAPNFSPAKLHYSWLDAVIPIAMSAFWLAYFFRNLKRRPLVALHDPHLAALLAKQHE
jgi:hypothetical protein